MKGIIHSTENSTSPKGRIASPQSFFLLRITDSAEHSRICIHTTGESQIREGLGWQRIPHIESHEYFFLSLLKKKVRVALASAFSNKLEWAEGYELDPASQ